MARRIPPERVPDLIRAATGVFIAQGYRRTQMADVASALGVAKGTLYGYVQGKEALFLLCVSHCDDPEGFPAAQPLPVATPGPGEVARRIRERLAEAAKLPALEAALAARRVPDLAVELEGVLRELYRVMRRHRHAVELLDRCGQDHPEVGAELQREVRASVQTGFTRYLEKRATSPQLRPLADPFLAARIAQETLTTWAVHIGWDPVPQHFDEKRAEDAVVSFVRSGLLRDADATRPNRRTP